MREVIEKVIFSNESSYEIYIHTEKLYNYGLKKTLLVNH